MAGTRACKQCRQAKRKCARNEADKACTQCDKRQISCSNSTRVIRVPEILPDQCSDRGFSEKHGIGLPLEITVNLVEHYINKLHDRPHSLFHIPTLRKGVRDGDLNSTLLLALCSLGSRFSGNPDIRMLKQQLTAQTKRLILADLENICLENLQTCILVANICAADMNPTSEALFFRRLKLLY